MTTPEVNLHVVPSDNQTKKKLLELIVQQSNFYAHQNRRNFTVTKEELKAFLGINFVLAISKLPTVPEYWRVDNLIGNDGIQNAMTRNRFCEIIQNLHFADNRKTIKQTTQQTFVLMKTS